MRSTHCVSSLYECLPTSQVVTSDETKEVHGCLPTGTQQTILSAYFDIPSKHTSNEYEDWMQYAVFARIASIVYRIDHFHGVERYTHGKNVL